MYIYIYIYTYTYANKPSSDWGSFEDPPHFNSTSTRFRDGSGEVGVQRRIRSLGRAVGFAVPPVLALSSAGW